MSNQLTFLDYAANMAQLRAPIDALFEKGRTPGTTPRGGASNAPLDRDTLAKVLSNEIQQGQGLSIADTVVNTDGTAVTYFLGPASPGKDQMVMDYYIVKVHVCSDARKASDVMKDYVAGHQNARVANENLNLRPINEKDARLGDVALRSASAIFWIRGESVFVSVRHELGGDNSGRPPSSSRSDLSIAPPPTATPTGSGDDAMVTRIARVLDQHLATFWVTDSKLQRRPRPGLTSSATINAKLGEPFTVQLTNLTGLHPVKTAEARDSNVAVLVEQGDASGKFVFIAMQPGETTLTLRVADAQNLAIAEVPAVVKVGAPAAQAA